MGPLEQTWKPAPEDGVTVFLPGLEKRGPHNERKRIYMTAVTPDLYRPMYGDKVLQFWDRSRRCQCRQAADAALCRELFRPLLDLHLGVKGDAVPPPVRQLGMAFNTVLAYRDVTQKIVYDNYMVVRANLAFLKD